MPTLAELKLRLSDLFDVECLPVHLTRVQCASPLASEFFKRNMDGNIKVTPVPVMHDDDHLSPSVVRSVCRNLDIDPAKFGLHLG